MGLLCLQARIGIVGVSLVAIVESKELLSFKLLDATVDASLAGPSASSRDPVLTVGAAIQDLSIRDLQADAHCTMVLQPNAPADSCSLALEFNQWADSSVKPSLVAELANPQFLLLFRSATFFTCCLSLLTVQGQRAWLQLPVKCAEPILCQDCSDKGSALLPQVNCTAGAGTT